MASLSRLFSKSKGNRGVESDPQPAAMPLGDFCIDEYDPIKVIVIGAGFSGITAGIRYAKYAM